MLIQDMHTGILLTYIALTGSGAGVLEQGDVLLEFDGHQISTDGTTQFRTGERISFTHLISQKFVGDSVAVCVLRDGERRELQVTLQSPHSLIPPHLSDCDPSYYIMSGLVFTVVTEPYLKSEFGGDFTEMAPVELLYLWYHGMPTTRAQQVVIVSQVLACDATVGFEDLTDEQVLPSLIFTGWLCKVRLQPPEAAFRGAGHEVVECGPCERLAVTLSNYWKH